MVSSASVTVKVAYSIKVLLAVIISGHFTGHSYHMTEQKFSLVNGRQLLEVVFLMENFHCFGLFVVKFP